MADPLSIAAGVSGLISLAGEVTLTCYRYGCAVKHAPKEIQDLLNEITSLTGVLASVQALIDAHADQQRSTDDVPPADAKDKEDSDPPPPYELGAPKVDLKRLEPPVADCRAVLGDLKGKLQRASFEDDHRVRKAFKRFTWPLKQPETREMLHRLERDKATFISALTSTNVAVSVQVLDVVQDIRGALAIDRFERKLERQRADMQRLYKWLSPVNPAVAHRAAQHLHLEGTGEWLFRETAWTEWAEGKCDLLWLRGIPGAGKTVSLSVLLEHCFAELVGPSRMLLYFYCDFREKDAQMSRVVLGTFICQLCSQLRDIPPEVFILLQRHSQDGREPAAPAQAELEFTLLELLKKCDSTTIVIDALDELQDRIPLVRFLAELPEASGKRVKVLASSRDAFYIREELSRAKHGSIAIEASNKDVESFIATSVASNRRLQRLGPDLRDSIQSSLRSGAQGMFRWVALQIDALAAMRTDRDIRNALGRLPSTLEETYERICINIHEPDRIIASRALSFLLVSPRPFTLLELAEAVIVEPEMTRLDLEGRWFPDDLLEVLGSLVVHDSSNDIVTLAHHSVKEYLSSDRCKTNTPLFFTPRIDAQVQITRTCLTYLLMEDFAGGATTTSEAVAQRCTQYPLLRYAARFWPFHARTAMARSPEVIQQVYALFAPARTPNFWAWLDILINLGYFSYHGPNLMPADDTLKRARRCPGTLTPLYYAASFGLDDAVTHLLDAGVDINKRGGMYGGTALHAAYFRGEETTADILLARGARTDIKDNNGMTADNIRGQSSPAYLAALRPTTANYFFDELRRSWRNRLPARYHEAKKESS